VRTRFCINGQPNQEGCRGPVLDLRNCNTLGCSTWSGWSEFSACSRSCSGGVSFRTRTCLLINNVTAGSLKIYGQGQAYHI